ncbi:hypothetical protein Goklo_021046 [Gossypium klotzschianum]|uniref:Uncharacterized protein n=1 Tax=Gossypium klotzschianum TaxID=34286 RepID=A0A7J8UTV0_9ROSI|nr:hypothetical protein [Gossypium klotzschianum]
MGRGKLEFGVRVWKYMVVSVKTSYRLVWNHPIFVGLVGFIIYLYRSFPFMFSILVTASPVLVCTAVLLGLLLSFGSPNIPEIDEKEKEKEEKISHKVSPLKTGATEGNYVVVRDVDHGDFVVERHVGERRGIVENAYGKVSLADNEISEVEEDDSSISYKMLVDERMGIDCDNGVIQGMSNDLLSQKREILPEMLGSEDVFSKREPVADGVRDRNLEVDHSKFAGAFSDVLKGDELESSLMSSWKHDVANEDDGDDKYLDSGSDGTENSSPDVSVTDIIPVLDELHPLLGSEAPQPALLSVDCSDAVSERSHGSSNGSVDSYELENQRKEEGKGSKTDNEDESKSAIKWTEDDQKNLIDLGTSELERNQRLETLIARRRAHKNMRSMNEKNLIDLDGANIPSHITAISTRQNPFELLYDPCEDLGLPPIPGSAPSISRPRNPFDLPCDSSQEKPDPEGVNFQEDFSGFNQRETVPQRESMLRRHESFHVGPSSFVVPRQELNWKPYFVPERLVTEGASFQRQSSEASESKMSSVPDTESVSSILDEDKQPNVSQETETILNEDHSSVHDEQESQSSGEVESVNILLAENRDVHHDVVEIILGDGENQLGTESNLSGATPISLMEFNSSEIHSRTEMVTEDSSSSSSSSLSSSSSSSSETDEEISDVKEEGFASFEPRDHETEEFGFSMQPSFEESESHSTSRAVDDNQHREPVYDSSPPSLEKFLSFSSVPSNTLAEISKMVSPLMLVESTDEGLKRHGETTEPSTTTFQEMHAAYSDLCSENERRATDMLENSMHVVKSVDSPRVSSSSSDHNVVEYFSTDAGSSSSDEELGKDVGRLAIDKENTQLEQVHISSSSEGSFIPKEDQMHSSNSVASLDVDHHHYKSGELSSTGLTHEHTPSGDASSSTAAGSGHVSVAQVSQVHSSKANIREEHKKESKMDQAQSPSSDSGIDAGLNRGITAEEISSESSYQDVPYREGSSPESDKQLLWYDTDMDEHDKIKEDMKAKTNAVLPVLEARSAEDIYLAFKQLHEGVDIEEVTVLSMIEKPPDHGGNKSKLPVFEARSLEDIHKAVRQLPESNPAEPPHSSGSKNESSKDTETETNVVLPILEARSAEDIDLAFKQLHEGVDVEEVIVPSMIEKLTDHGDNKSKLPIVEARSLEDIHKAVRQLPESNPAEPPYSSGLRNESSTDTNTETNVVLPVLETRSAEDIDLAFKQLHEGVNVEEVIVPSMIEKLPDLGDNKSKLPVVEARSLEDLDKSIQQLAKPNPAYSSGSRNESSKDAKTETNVVLPVLEARSAEDIDLAFKQLHEGVDIEEVIVPSMIEKLPDHGDNKSKLRVVEARSLEDIDKAIQQLPKSNPAELPHSSVSRNEPSKDMKTETNVVLPVLEARSAEDLDLAFKQLHEGADVEEVIVPSMIVEPQDDTDNKSKLPVVEARSLKELHNAVQQGLESDPAKLLHSSGVNNAGGSRP